jgi:membrane associated rhomboid family serine protease
MKLPALLIIGYWALIQFLNAAWLGGGEMLRGGGVAYFAHIGGFVVGILYVLLLGGDKTVARKRR